MSTSKETLFCSVCGVSSDEKIVCRCNTYKEYGDAFCSKHYAQLNRYGRIIDPSPRTTNDRNECVMHDDYAEIIIRSQDNKIDAVVKIDLDDVDKCLAYKWAVSDRVPGKKQYARGRIYGRNVRMHRFILGYEGDLVVDHINHDTFDNRKSNLRIVSPQVNDANRQSQKAYRTKNGKWRSYMKRNGEYINVGTFDTYEEAEMAWDAIANDYINHALTAEPA